MMNDERFAEHLRQTLEELDPVPAAPREAMWARIQAQRQAAVTEPAAPGAAVIELRPRGRRGAWVQWGAALAAMLVLGIGLGRYSVQQSGPQPLAEAPVPVLEDGPAGAERAVSAPYRLAATQHLQRTETLLTTLSVDSRPDQIAEVTGWARELLTGTRLLLTSPAAEDPAMARLLEDLELLLAQIAAIPSAVAEDEVQLIQEGLNQSDVLLRLRAATTVRRTVGT